MPKQSILSLDIGGTKISAGLVVDRSTTVRGKTPTTVRSYQSRKADVLAAIHATIKRYPRGAYRAIGVGITGQVIYPAGVVTQSPNLPTDWRNVPLRAILERNYRVSVRIDNDAHCMALAEAIVGAGKRHAIVLGVTLGTGVGVGFMLHQRLYRGGRDAVEFGHMIVADTSERCSCGRRGHLEALVSGRALERAYAVRSDERRSAKEIVALARRGNKIAKSVMESAGTYLGIGLANWVNMLSPNIVVVGGGLGQAASLIARARRTMKPLLLFPNLRSTPIVPATTGENAGLLGASLLFKQR